MVDAISSRNLSFKYETSPDGLNDINFDIKQGEMILLTGDSGSGKSTLMRCFNGLIPEITDGELSGDLFFEGEKYKDLKMYQLNKKIGSVFQNPRSQFFTTNTTAELVFPMENYEYSKEEMDSQLEKSVERFDIKDLLNRNIFELSSGERQMIALVSALIMNQSVVLFDEPSANLDYGNTIKLGRIIEKMKKQGITVIVADHRFYYLNGIVDRVFLMDKGHLSIYDSEESFKSGSYDTRSFDLFSLDIEMSKRLTSGKTVAGIRNVSFKNILKNLNLDIKKNEVTVLVGKNGVGKTTLAKLLCESYKGYSGRIEKEELPFFIMQDPDFQLFGTSVYNELLLVTDDNKRIDQVLKELGLYELKSKHPFDLSGGQKQRLQIAMALLCDREFIIFDEPTSGLDVSSMLTVAKKIESLKENAAVFVLSHDYEFIRNIADRIIYLEDGEISEDFYLEKESVKDLNNIFIKLQGENS